MNGRTNSNNNSTMTILGDGIPLDPPSSFLCEARNSKVDITWVDPKDKYATPEGEQMEDTDQLVSVWSYTKIVRKEGSQPTSPSDGVTVCTNTTRNQYQSTIFEDTSVTNGVTYYYAAYAYNTAGTYSDGAFSDGITPIEWDPVLANNSWEQIDSACTQGVAQSLWNVGDEINITALNETVTCIIGGFNHDTLTDGGTAVITFFTKNLMAAVCSEDLINYMSYRSWGESPCCDWFTHTLLPGIDSSVRSHIQTINMRYGDARNDSIKSMPIQVFLPSMIELGIDPLNDIPGEGSTYPYYTTASNRIKRRNNGSGNAYQYYTRSYKAGTGTMCVYYVNAAGTNEHDQCSMNRESLGFVHFGFCIGHAIK